MNKSVVIYRPSKTAMQSGRAKTQQWIMEFVPSDRKTVDSMMGWISSKDTTRQLKLQFDSKEDAIRYAQENELSFSVKEPHSREIKPKSYAENFSYHARQYSDLANQGQNSST